MLGSAIYNTVALAAIVLLMSEYLSTHHDRSHRLLGITYLLGIGGWLYYQIVSTFFSFAGPWSRRRWCTNRIGPVKPSAVLASILVFWAYGRGVSFQSRNQRQRHRAMWFWSTAAAIFISMFFWITCSINTIRCSPRTSVRRRTASGGFSSSGWDTPFIFRSRFYMAGLLCWSYTVIKLLTMGRLAGYGLGLMFIAGYALLYSNLTLMVVLGVMLLTMDRSRRDAVRLRGGPGGHANVRLVGRRTCVISVIFCHRGLSWTKQRLRNRARQRSIRAISR